MLSIERIQHIGLIVPDADEAAAWYRNAGGFQKKAEFRTAAGIRAVFVAAEKPDLLYELIEHPAGSDIARKAQREGGWLDHVAFQTQDLEAELQKARALGMQVIEGICTIPEFWENGFQYFLVRSPSGEKVEYCRVL